MTNSTVCRFDTKSLFRFPSEIKASLFGEWLEISDIKKFDIALTSNQRTDLLAKFGGYGPYALHGPKTSRYDYDQFLRWLVDRSIKLKSIVVPYSSHDQPYLRKFLTISGPHLQGIDFSHYNSSLDNDVVIYVTNSSSKLTSLILGDGGSQERNIPSGQIKDATLLQIAHRCRYLKELNLNNRAGLLTDNALIAIAGSCPHLEVLELCGGQRLTDEGLFAVASNCPRLKKINLHGCRKITDEGIRRLVTHCPSLTSISLCLCRALTDDAMRMLSQLKQLKTLKVPFCNNISDIGVTAAVNGCSHLEELNLSGCRNLTDQSCMSISLHLPHLRILRLKGCVQVSDTGMTVLSEHCEALEELNFPGRGKATETSLSLIRKKYPDIKILC